MDDAADRTRPQIVGLPNGKKFMVFLGSSDARTDPNKQCLMYSVTDDEGKWIPAKPVAEDGTVDGTPSIRVKGDKVVIAWSDAKGDLEVQNGDPYRVRDNLCLFDISCAVYDSNSGEMSQEINLGKGDNFFDGSPQIAFDETNNRAYITYMKSDLSKIKKLEDLTNMETNYRTMAYCVIDVNTKTIKADEKFKVINHDSLTDPLVFDLQSAVVKDPTSGMSFLLNTYTVDEDKKLKTDADREMYLEINYIVPETGELKNYPPIRLSSDNVSQTAPKLTKLASLDGVAEGETVLTWIEEGKKFALLDISELLNLLITYEYVSVDTPPVEKNWYKDYEKYAISKAGKTLDNLGEDVLGMADNKFPVQVKSLNENEEMESVVSSYKLASQGRDIYIFYADFADATKTSAVELFAAKYSRSLAATISEGDRNDTGFLDTLPVDDWTWTYAKQITSFNKVIDEFDVTMDKNANISVVSNFYSQTIDANNKLQFSKNQLVELDFGTESSVELVNGVLDFPLSMVVGEEEALTFSVVNNGLITAEGYNIKVKQVIGGQETVLCDDTVGEEFLSDDKREYSVPWTVPQDTTDVYIVVEIEETGVSVAGKKTYTFPVPSSSKVKIENVATVLNQAEASISADIINRGNVASDSLTCEVYTLSAEGEKKRSLGTFPVSALTSGEVYNLEEPLNIKVDDFDDFGMVKICVEIIQDGETVDTAYNTISSSQPIKMEIDGGKSSIGLGVGSAHQLATKVAPWDDARITGKVAYTSTDNSIALVDEKGKVYGVSKGQTEVYAHYPQIGLYEKIIVNVTDSTSSSGDDTGAIVEENEDDTYTVILPEGTENTPITFTPSKGETVDDGTVLRITSPEEKAGEIITKSIVNSDGSITFMVPEDVEFEIVNNSRKFVDVNDEWFADEVDFVTAREIFLGTSKTTFSPKKVMTRGQFATALWRLEQKPEESGNTFTDIRDGSFCEEAAEWGAKTGIIEGVGDNRFAPNRNVTRQEIVTLMYRYAKYLGLDVSKSADLSKFPDASKVSTFAQESMKWAVAEGIIQGKGGKLDPKGNATRAEVATIIRRFIERLLE